MLFCALFIFLNVCFSQGTRTVSGRVADEKGSPLPGVSLSIKGSSHGTVTDKYGNFVFVVPENAKVLVATLVGFETVEKHLSLLSQYEFTLTPLSKSLDEVVVTSLGITKERRTLGYATQSVKNEMIVDKGDAGLFNTLQGKIAGADITGSGGAAGSSTSIILRGITSFTGSQSPLLVVDGVPISDNVDESTIGLYSGQSSNRSMDLNVNNIESVNILSGPAAAALYGSRASHGAIMITTKRGSGQKDVLKVAYSFAYTVQKVYGFPELQNKYGQGSSGIFNAISSNSFGPAFGSTPSVVNGLVVSSGGAANPGNPQYVNGKWYVAGETIPYQAYPDNINSYFHTGTVVDNNLTINSGDSKNYYGVNLGHSKQKGILPNSEFNKTSIGFNSSMRLSDKLSAKSSATYFSTYQQGPSQGSNGAYSSYSNVYRMPRSLNFEYFKNNYTTRGGYNNWYIPNIYNNAIQDSSSASDNPYFAANRNPIKSQSTRILGNVTLGYDLTSWLNVSYRAGVDAYTDRRKRVVAIGSSQVVRSTFTGAPGTTTGGIMQDVFYRNEVNGDLMISAKRKDVFIKGLDMNALFGHGVLQQKYQHVSQTGYGLAVPGYYNISNASNLSLSNEYNNIRRLWGIYGQISMSYNNYLFLELTGRQDRSSTLPADENAYFYPSVSSSFVLTDAFQRLRSDVLSFAKLRLAYAKVGNDAPVYSLDNTFNSAAVGNNVANYSFPFGSTPGFAANSNLGNKSLSPEFTSTTDLGINLGFFKNCLNVDATVYKSVSTDQIVPVGLPASSGYLSRYINIGKMENKGLELTINATPVKTKHLTWTLSGNFSLNRNKVVALSPGVKSFSFSGTAFSGLIPTIAVGEAYGVIRGSKFLTNARGERLIDSTTGLFAGYVSDVTVLDPNRKWISGLTNTFTFKGFSLSFLIDYKHGGQFESFSVATMRALGALKVTEDREEPFILPGVIDLGGGKYRPNNIQINGQTYYNSALGGATGSSTSNEFAVFDASTFRLREVSIGIDFDGSKIGCKLFSSARWSLFGRNLFYYAPNAPIDPELSTQGGGTSTAGGLIRGLELGSAPNTRNFGASLRVTF